MRARPHLAVLAVLLATAPGGASPAPRRPGARVVREGRVVDDRPPGLVHQRRLPRPRRRRAVRSHLAADVLFAFDSADLSPGGRGAVAEVAARVRSEATGEVVVVGHTDSVGDTPTT